MCYIVTFSVIFFNFRNALCAETSFFQPVRAIIFDMDGLLLNSASIYLNIRSKIFARHNKTFTKSMQWRIWNFTAETMVDNFDLNITPEAYREESNKLFKEKVAEVKFMPGAERLVRHLHSHKVPIAIATGNNKQFFDLIPDHYKQFFSLFHHIVTGYDPAVKNGKPSPDIFLICMDRFQMSLEPKEVLVFEDLPQGVLGARRAGMQVVMVPDPDLPEEFRSNATKVLDTLEHFQPSDFGLPPYI